MSNSKKWFSDHQIIFDNEVKEALDNWGIEVVDDLKFITMEMWLALMKPKCKFVGLERAKIALEDLQKERYDAKAHAPLP
eukprot:7712917-Ditylum_brightwellii.AAC.1